jgi:hypothetical protein
MSRLIRENDVYALFAPNGMAHLHVGHIDVLPRVDARPVVHANWVVRPSNPEQVYCSECAMILAGVARGFFYCPNCGAKMDKEEDE